MGRIGSVVPVSDSFQIFALRMLLRSASCTWGGVVYRVISGGMFAGVKFPRIGPCSLSVMLAVAQYDQTPDAIDC